MFTKKNRATTQWFRPLRSVVNKKNKGIKHRQMLNAFVLIVMCFVAVIRIL